MIRGSLVKLAGHSTAWKGFLFTASLSKVHWTFFTFVICHIAWVLCSVGMGVGFCPDSIRARQDSVWTRLNSVCVQKDTHLDFAVNNHVLISGTLAALAFEIHLADAPGEAEADITRVVAVAVVVAVVGVDGDGVGVGGLE